MPFTTATDNAMQDHILGGPDYVRVATVYIGVSSTTPTKGGTGVTEPSGGGYAVVPKTNDATNFPASAANGNVKSNGTVITFPTAAATWLGGVNLTHVVVWNDPTLRAAGNLLMYGPIPVGLQQPVMSGNMLTIPVGSLDLQLA
jgi:hypothetical protein